MRGSPVPPNTLLMSRHRCAWSGVLSLSDSCPPFVRTYAAFCCPYAGESAALSTFTWHGTLPDAPSLGYLLHLTFVTYGLTCVSKTRSRHGQGSFWLRLVCLFLDMLWCSKGVHFIEWVESVLPQSNCSVQIIYLSNNSSGDFTVTKKAPRSIKHLQKNPWSHFYIASTGFQCNFIKKNQK